MTPRIQKIYHKLRQLVTYDSNLTVFGAKHHKYSVYSCLTEAEIQEFERQYHVELPDGYRSFLLEIGNGGVGPDYGLHRLQDSMTAEGGALLSHPFPHREKWNLHYTAFATPQDFDAEYFREEHVQGTLSICERGCGHEWLLVVTGEERGTIWGDLRAGDEGLVPERLSFLDWYEAWLDKSLE